MTRVAIAATFDLLFTDYVTTLRTRYVVVTHFAAVAVAGSDYCAARCVTRYLFTFARYFVFTFTHPSCADFVDYVRAYVAFTLPSCC